MSSSVFIENNLSTADASNSDSNLVVVYGKNGISFDDKGLENLIEEKKISSISVIRLTSPTPSMQDEEDEAEKLEEILRRQEIGSADESYGSEDDANNSSKDDNSDTIGKKDSSNEEDNEDEVESDSESSEEDKTIKKKQTRRGVRQTNVIKQKKITQRRKRERPEIVGLRLEEFYPPDDANEIIKKALKMAGLGPDKKSKSDYDFQLFVIQNDHCYTPFTSPSQMEAKLAADKLEAEKQTARRRSSVLQSSAGKQLFLRKKQSQVNVHAKSESVAKSNNSLGGFTKDNLTVLHKQKKDVKDINEISEEDFLDDYDEIHSSLDEKDDYAADDNAESALSGSDESGETDNDRDSDLDFDVNNPKGRKRKSKLLKPQKRVLNVSKINTKARRFCSQDESLESTNKAIISSNYPTCSTSSVVQRQKSIVKVVSDPGRITVRSTPSKVTHIVGPTNVLSPAIAALPPIPKKQSENRSLLNKTSATTMATVPPKTYVLVKGSIEKKSTIPSSPQTHKEIVINKQIMSSPKTKGFTDLTKLIEQTEKQTTSIKTVGPSSSRKSSHTATITSVVTLTPTSAAAALKGFMPIETAAKIQLPAQISLQTHQSSSELEAEHDKQLDLINSIVQDEMQKSNENANEQLTNINENIPELVKMLESTEKVLVNTNAQRRNVTETQQNISRLTGISINSGGGIKCVSSNQNIHLPTTTVATSATANNLVGGIDIASASLLANTEGDDADDLPDDILQQVVELIKDDKTLQEAVEKQVFGSGVCSDQGINNNNIIINQNPPPLAPISQQPIRLQETTQTPSKSIIQMAISNVPTTLSTTLPSKINPVIITRTTITTPTTATITGQISKTSPLIRKEPIQIIRGNGRVITLPPIEAPTTRAKRRAQAQPIPHPSATVTSAGNNTSFIPTSSLSESSLDSSMHSNSSTTAASGSNAITVQEKKIADSNNRRRGSKENISASAVGSNQKLAKTQKTAATKKGTTKSTANKAKVDTGATASGADDDDDPNKLWCICRQPHNNRFMICCDACEDWFHGTCVSITKAMGLEMEQKGIDWTCPKCKKKLEEKKQPKITQMLAKRSTEDHTGQSEPSPDTAAISTPPSIITAVVGPSTAVQHTSSTNNVTTSSIDILNITPKNTTTSLNLETSPQLKLQSGQIINLKDYSTTTSKRATIIQTSTSNTGAGQTTGQKKLYVASGQPNLKMTSQTGTPIRTITMVKQITTPQQQQQQHQSIKIIKNISTATTSASPNVNTAAITAPVTTAELTDNSTLCIVCKKVARHNSIYCSDDCIRKHAQNALNSLMSKSQSDSSTGVISPLNKSVAEDKTKRKSKGLFEELLSAADRKPKVERVNVYERKSGRVLTGNSAPTAANLKKWLQDNPTFEVIQPGSTQALDLEKRQKLRSQRTSSPTILKSAASSPPPLKMFSSTSSNIPTNKLESSAGNSQYQTHSPKVQTKSNKSITDYLKSTSANSTSPRPSTPKQLQKYPQQVGIKPDKVSKTPEDSKTSSKEKTSSAKRQTSTESSGKSSSNDGEPIRGVVRRTLKEQLLLRIKEEIGAETEAKDNTDKANNVPKLSEDEVEEFAKTTELEMYHYFNKDTGIKYKAKYRSLVFNIKDRKNHTLFAKICGKLIEPKQLVRMSPEELASQELAQWREQENKHQLEMIKKSELDMLACAKNYVLKTHKGEEVIVGKSSDYANVDITIPVEDVVSALNKSELPNEAAATAIRKESQNHWSDVDVTLLSSHSHTLSETLHSLPSETKLPSTHLKEKDKERDKEKEREKDKDKERTRARDREREKHHKGKDRHHEKSRLRKRSLSHSRSRSREKVEKRHKSSHRDEKRERGDKERNKERSEREHHGEGNDKKSTLSDVKKSTNTQSRQPVKKHQEQQKASTNPLEAYNLIDQILESTKTVEEAANLVTDKDKEKDIENQRKTAVTPQPMQTASSTVSTSSGNADPATVIDIPANLSSTESDQEPTSTVSIPTPPHDPYSRFMVCSSPSYADDLHYTIVSLWTGNINMVDVTSFQLTLQPIFGNSVGLAKLLPKELDVVGRIGPEAVWDYISKIKKNPNKEIVVLRLIPASESETVAYKILYEYLDNRNRLGVIKSTSSQIKDFYIFPLGSGKNVPTLLHSTEPVDFYDDPYRPDVLIGIITRVTVSKRSNSIPSQAIPGGASTSSALNKLSMRSNDLDTFTPPGSPKPKKRRQSILTHKVDEIDVDAIIKAPITSKAQKAVTTVSLSKTNDDDANSPYSPGGSSDDELPIMPVKVPTTMDPMQAAEDELKRKMEEINRQIAAQEMEIAGLLTGEPTTFNSSASTSTSNVLANISIPSNLSQILASIKTTGKDQSAVPPPPPLIGSLLTKSSSSSLTTTTTENEHNPNDSKESSAHDEKTTGSNSTSLLAKLSEAELLSMVPDDIEISPNKSTCCEEPPPPGV